MDKIFDILFPGIFFLVAGFFVYRIIKNKGIKSAMFSAHINTTVGEVSGIGQSMIDTMVKVHTLGNSGKTEGIGLEFVAKSMLSYQMVPISLSVSEAKNLINLLELATAGTDTGRAEPHNQAAAHRR